MSREAALKAWGTRRANERAAIDALLEAELKRHKYRRRAWKGWCKRRGCTTFDERDGRTFCVHCGRTNV